MDRFFRCALLAALCCGLAGAWQPAGAVVITEVMTNPASPEPEWEWIEIYNDGRDPLDLTGWVVDDNNAIGHSSANIASGTVAAGGVAILFNDDALDAADFEAAWGAGINLVGVAGWSNIMALNNSGDTIGLWDSFAAYNGNSSTHTNAILSVPLPASGETALYLTDVTDQGSWAQSVLGVDGAFSSTATTTPVGNENTGEDVGSPGQLRLVPEPGLAALGLLGVAGVLLARRRRPH